MLGWIRDSMRVYLDENVLEMGRRRINWCFDEFDRICVNVSGGKDSTVVFELAYEIAQERNQKLWCMWIDQEAEYASTEGMVRSWMERDGVEPVWVQCPMKITNSTSDEEDFLDCWNPEKEDLWMREKSDMSYKENTYGTDRFTELFEEILFEHVADSDGGIDVCALGGVRAEESPTRYLGMTNGSVHKGVTYGTSSDYDNVKTIYPIYDWSYSDVWKLIHDNGYEYNDIYDVQYKENISIRDMRVSNLNHETAVTHLFTLQEFEPDTWNKLVKRLDGIHMAGQLEEANYVPSSLPHMFKDWREYRNYLLRHVVEDEEKKKHFKRHFFTHDLMGEHLSEERYRANVRGHVRGILTNDWEGNACINTAENKVSFPISMEISKRKKEWLRNCRPDIWKELYEDGVVQKPPVDEPDPEARWGE